MTSVLGFPGTLIVIAKRPEPGQVKTRLVPPLTHEQARDLAAAALSDTLHVVDRVPSRRRLLAFAGSADGWLPSGWDLSQQPDGGLDHRLAAAFAAAEEGPALLVGMDTPQLAPRHLSFDADRYDACLGPAADGGYWAIGFRDPTCAAGAIEGVPMSTRRTAHEQLRRLRAAGLTVQVLPELVDVDDIGTATLVAAHAPHTRFADAYERIVRPIVRAV